ncbi:MAG: EthD domain-containing protein [Chloroflexi bacterium]|nr:EthD domain-containing protein [Chloroflexota bacterium]
MIKLIYPLHRKPGMSREEFQAYWRGTHGPLVASVQGVLRIRRYVQSHSTEMGNQAGIEARQGFSFEPFDGVAELWWDSAEDLAAAGSTPEGRAAGQLLLEDERNFIDLARSPMWYSEEHPIIGEATS